MTAPAKKSTTNPKRLTSSDTPGKRDSQSMSWKKNWVSLLVFQIKGFSVFKYEKTSCKGVNYSTLKSKYSTTLWKIGVLELKGSIRSNSLFSISRFPIFLINFLSALKGENLVLFHQCVFSKLVTFIINSIYFLGFRKENWRTQFYSQV